jgi:hypothetical protein
VTEGGFDYPALLRAATLGVVREVLERAAAEGLPGEHHVYVTFRTAEPGVEIPPGFRTRYPETMTIVLQHQYEGLAVDAEAFAVTLRFGGSWERLRVPFAALTAFLDPSVPFGLDFTQFAAGVAEPAVTEPPPAGAGEPRESGAVPLAAVEPESPPDGEPPRGGDLLPFRRT